MTEHAADQPSDAIDAVVTWVDGDHPAHRAKRAQFVTESSRTGNEATRFANRNEIVYCLDGLLRFAPWLRNIYVVTDAQIPQAVKALWAVDPALRQRLHIVDHREIFRDHLTVLPSFNSLAIETMLYRIPDLSPRFVVFNDDFLLVRPVSKADFFTADGPILRGRWMSQALRFLPPIYEVIDRAMRRKPRFSFKQVQIRSARLAGAFGTFLCSGHTPYPVQTATIADYFVAHPDLLAENIRARFRKPGQLHMMVLANHLELAAQRGVFRDTAEDVFIRADVDRPERIREKLKRVETDGAVKFLCIGSLDMAEAQMQAEIMTWLREWFDRKDDTT